jgi:hypothetical protein
MSPIHFFSPLLTAQHERAVRAVHTGTVGAGTHAPAPALAFALPTLQVRVAVCLLCTVSVM